MDDRVYAGLKVNCVLHDYQEPDKRQYECMEKRSDSSNALRHSCIPYTSYC